MCRSPEPKSYAFNRRKRRVIVHNDSIGTCSMASLSLFNVGPIAFDLDDRRRVPGASVNGPRISLDTTIIPRILVRVRAVAVQVQDNRGRPLCGLAHGV